MKSLVLYSSKYGTTASCANHIAKALNCDILSLDKANTINLKAYDQIILGSSVYMGRLRKPVVQFMSNHQESLQEKSMTIFFCCNETTDYAALIPPALHHAGVHHLGFELNISKMGFLDRFITKKVSNTTEDISMINQTAIDKLVLSVQ